MCIILPAKTKLLQLVEAYNQLTSLVQFVAEHAFKAAYVEKKPFHAKSTLDNRSFHFQQYLL